VKVEPLSLEGLLLIRPDVHEDARGIFLESYNRARYAAAGIAVPFVQDNHSRSTKGTLRGLHYQSEPGQAKLMRVGTGRIFDVAVDIRPQSATFGQWEGIYLDAREHAQLLVPVGFAHGFCVLSDSADVLYKVSSVYDPGTERSLSWCDPDLAVDWPVAEPLLSERDRHAPSFAELRRELGAS